jgi:hypothetical protein
MAPSRSGSISRICADDDARYDGIISDASEVWPNGPPRVGESARLSFGEIIGQGSVTSAILNAVVAEELPGPGSVFLEVRAETTIDRTSVTAPPSTR